MAIVYKITNTVNGKIYIGYTSKTLEERWKRHISFCKTNKCFFASRIRKYGAAAFKTEVLVEDTDDLWCLNFAEPLLIKFFNSTDRSVGYNSALGGGSIRLPTIEIKAKNSAAAKARWANPEYRAKYAAAFKASFTTPEIKAKRSAAAKACWVNPEYRAKCAAAIKASFLNPEYRDKNSAAAKARWVNPEYRAKRSATIEARRVTRKLLKLSINESGLSPEIQGTSSRVDP